MRAVIGVAGTMPDARASNDRMGRSASLAGVVVVLGLVGCQGNDQAGSVEEATSAVGVTTPLVTATEPGGPPPSPEEKLLGWIRACDVRMILFTHENVAWVRFKGGGQVRLRLDEDADARVSDAAFT